MQQLTQKLGSGDMMIQEVPYPQLGKGMVIVKNHYSISDLKLGTKTHANYGAWLGHLLK